MTKTLFVFLVFISLSFYAHGQTIDVEKSQVTFNVSNMAFNTVEGTIKGLEGSIRFDTKNTETSIFDVCLDASTIDTGNSMRDNHLKNEDFFEVTKYPTICFKSSQIVAVGDGYKTLGVLTMHGISREIEIPFTYRAGVLIGDFKVNRFEYQIGEESGKFMVGEEISVEIVVFLKYS